MFGTSARATVVVAGAALALLVGPVTAAHPTTPTGGDRGAVADWIRHNAHPANALPSGHPSPRQLHPIQGVVGDAVVVGLGAQAEGTHELSGASRAVTGYLVKQMGFHTIALEDDWTAGVLLNAYLRTGHGDLRKIVAQLAPRFRTNQMVSFVRWVRRYNHTHGEDVRFVGIDATSTRQVAYDAVADYVADVAPDRLPELRGLYELIRPRTENIWDWNDYFYQQVQDKRPYVKAARKAYRLVRDLPVDHHRRGYRLALHNAYTIRAYYTIAALHPTGYRDKLMAHNLIWWRARTGEKVVALSAPHMAVDAELRVSYPPHPTRTLRTAGTYLRDRYHHRYVAIGFTFGHGSVTSGLASGQLRRSSVPAASEEAAEHLLGQVPWRCYLLDLRTPAPAAVRAWLSRPSRLRTISMGSYDPARAAEYFVGGGSLRQWYDALVHTPRVTAVHLIGQRP